MTDTPATHAPPCTLRFALHRDTDVTGVSGTGHVGDGVRWPDGTCVVRWRTSTATTTIYDNIAHVRAIHCHGGATRLQWVASPAHGPDGNRTAFVHGAHDAAQDICEAVPWGSVRDDGAFAGSPRPETLCRPWWIAPEDWPEYRAGYEDVMAAHGAP